MCGIVGAVAQRDVVDILIEGLRRLEYRGYDSAGVAVINSEGELQRLRRLGKVKELSDAVELNPTPGGTGIAHTRWATHGEPSERNAHPHISSEKIAVVHNGIIENHVPLREQLQSEGYVFSSDTDTEVIAHLVEKEFKNSNNLLEAVKTSVKQLEGAYGTVIIDKDDASRAIVARSGSPLVIGLGIGENFIASDQLALLPVTRRFIFLEEGDVAEITRKDVSIFDKDGNPVKRTHLPHTHTTKNASAIRSTACGDRNSHPSNDRHHTNMHAEHSVHSNGKTALNRKRQTNHTLAKPHNPRQQCLNLLNILRIG